jgi:lipopolysaccharide export system protein LptA
VLPRASAFLIFAAAFATSSATVADPLAMRTSGEPLEMVAEHLDLDVEAKTALLTGAVKLTKGALTVACPRVEIRYDQVPHVTWAKGSGGVVAEVKGVRAEAPEVELDMAAQALSLRGGVRLTRGEGWITADQATIQIATGKVSMTGVKGSIPVERGALPGAKPPP